MSRGEVWLSSLDPTIGSEIQKTRPCVVVSPDELNQRLRTVIVAPLTTGSFAAPFRLRSNFEDQPGLIVLDQVRAVDKIRLRRQLGKFDDQSLSEVLGALRAMFGE